MVSPQCQQIEFHLIITNQLFDMWPMFNQAGYLVITCLNALLTHHINIGLGFQGSAVPQPRSQGLSSLPLLVVGRKTLVAAGHMTTQNLGGEKICLVGGVAEYFVWLM